MSSNKSPFISRIDGVRCLWSLTLRSDRIIIVPARLRFRFLLLAHQSVCPFICSIYTLLGKLLSSRTQMNGDNLSITK